MKSLLLIIISFSVFFYSMAQPTAFINDPDARFKEAKDYFQKKEYSLAYPLFRELSKDLQKNISSNYPVTVQEIEFYDIVCGLMQNEDLAVTRAENYIFLSKNEARVEGMSFYLGEYFFRHQNFKEALENYKMTDVSNIEADQLSSFQFHKGYSYFFLDDYAQGKPLLYTVKNNTQSVDYYAANYYYGLIAFKEGNYTDALNSLLLIEGHPEFSSVAPYYIAQVYYLQGDKQKSIQYAEGKLKMGNTQMYDLQLRQMIGHTHFELKEFAKALPYLQEYVSKSNKVTREDIYELSYSYYRANDFQKAIEGFKQLSGGEDALSQHAMYLLGDAYLKTGQKANARSAFLFCASNSSNNEQKEISKFQYAKLSYDLGYQNEALNGLRNFVREYPMSVYNVEAKELLVAALANTNNYKDALNVLEEIKNPTSQTRLLISRVYFGRATELINDGLLLEADRLLDRALQNSSDNNLKALIYFWKGEIAYRQNNNDNAIQFLNNYLQDGAPANGEANATTAKYNLGYAYLKKEAYNLALQNFEPVGSGNTRSDLQRDAYLRTGDSYYMLKNYTKAKAIYKTIIDNNWPAADYATYQSAMIDGIKNPKDKIGLMNEILRKYPKTDLQDDANMEIALTYMSSEKFSDAIPYLQKVIQSTATDAYKPRAYYTLGTAYYNLDKNKEALDTYQTLVKKYPNTEESTDALDDIRRIYVEEGKSDEYIGYMKNIGKSISVNAADSLSYSIAETKYEDGNMDEALVAFENYLKQYPQGAYTLHAQYYKSEIFHGRKDWDKALFGYEAVAAKAPNQFAEKAALNVASIYYFEKKDYVKAERYYQLLSSLASGSENKAEAARGLLRSRYQLQKWNEALANARELLAGTAVSTDDKALANLVIGKAAQENKNFEEAIKSYNAVITQNKAALAAEARYGIAAILFDQNKLTDAEKAAFETINKSGSYGYWVTKSYLLLGDIYFRQKDYFNAKATYKSVVENGIDETLKAEAKTKLQQVIAAEKK